MQFSVKPNTLPKSKVQGLILGCFDDFKLSSMGRHVDAQSAGRLAKLLKRDDFSGKAGQTLILHDLEGTNLDRCIILGLGKRNELDADRLITAATAIANTTKSLPIKKLVISLDDVIVCDRDDTWLATKLTETFSDAAYQYLAMKGKQTKSAPSTLASVELLAEADRSKALKKGVKLGGALSIGKTATKDLSNAPGNLCTPTYLADQAKALAKQYDRLTTTVLDEKQMQKLGMGAFLSVSKGSDEPGKMIIIQYRGAAASVKPHVLVGKGITFDTGGISLKGGAGMWEMIYDMCGAASVFGTLKTIAEIGPKMNVVGVLACAENMPSARASKPGDIVTTMSGQTVEILNTDAEGRLVLCDALTYVEKFNPATVVDVATLTGAVIMALGSQASAVFSNDDEVARNLIAAGEQTRDRAWQLPIWETYQPQINSAFADMQNIGGKEAGSITAACFLARFAKKYRWAHMDIAGTSFKWAGTKKGATGRPVALLTEYLLQLEGRGA